MSNKKMIYLAGKVSGLPSHEVWHKFEAKEFELIKQGHEVYNPVRIVADHNSMNEPWSEIMKACILLLLDSDELHLMPCWKDSEGAKLEHHIALQLGMPIVYH